MIWGLGRRQQEATADKKNKEEKGQRLPAELQKLVEKQEDTDFYDDVYPEYHVDSTETPYRYAAYANRIRTVLLSVQRYVAYTSDIGESFRPVAHPYIVRTAYGISWSYILGDVIHEGYKAYIRNCHALAPPGDAYKDATTSSSITSTNGSDSNSTSKQGVTEGMRTGDFGNPLSSSSVDDSLTSSATSSPGSGHSTGDRPISLIEDYRLVMARRMLFQSVASMGLPAFTIHTVVRYSGRIFKNSKTALVRTWAPIGLGLSVVPFLPYLFDEPVEEAVEWSFREGLRAFAGDKAVQPISHPNPAPPLTWQESRAVKPQSQTQQEQEQEREQNKQGGILNYLGFGSGNDNGKSKKE